MASFFQEDCHSSDSEDDDYVPEGEISSDEYNDEEPLPPDDEIETKRKGKSKKNHKGPSAENEKNKTDDESPSTKTNVDEKQRANDLYKSFLEEVEADMKAQETNAKFPENANTYDSPEVTSSDSGIKSIENTPKQPSSDLFDLFEFAGETVSASLENVTKIETVEKSTSSAAERKVPDKPTNQPPVIKRKGLDAVLGYIMNKKSRMTTLQKTSLDWKKFKSQHGISEELQNYNRGRGGYIERQRFLQRSDVRSYEIERDMRMSKRKKD